MSKVASSGSTSAGVRNLTTAGLVAVVGAIVLGILGMHGLGQHGMAPAATDHSSAAGTGGTELHAGHVGVGHVARGMTVELADASSTSPVADGPVVSPEGQGGTAGHMVTLCAAMLLAAAAGVVLTLLLRPMARCTALRVRTLTRLPTTRASSRLGTGPPAVWKFSVVRC